MEKIEAISFVKWAGGKKQLIEQFKPLFPKKFTHYFEPFVGGGAVAFYVIQKYKPKEVFLSDINEELINAYNIIKTDVESLIAKLREHKKNHMKNQKEYYYKIRDINPKDLSKLNNAARFIYLNRTCFNGLYRVNSKGGFNVPIGSYKNPDIVQETKLKEIAKLLQNVTVKVMSFEKVVELAKKGDFVYFDPPYYPLKKGLSFTTYTKGNFLEKEQKKLANVFRELDKKGCFCMESNSDTEFIKGIYFGYKIHTVEARRLINSKVEGRGKINEVLIKNY
ncbi:MAG: DNA adenine methylase [archaeon]